MDNEASVGKDKLSIYEPSDRAAGFDGRERAEVFVAEHDKARGESCETQAYEEGLEGNRPKERDIPEAKLVAGAVRRPAGRHTRTVCTVRPAPLASCLVEEVDDIEEYQSPVEGAEEVFTVPYNFNEEMQEKEVEKNGENKAKCYVVVRMPNAKDRLQARMARSTTVFGIRSKLQRRVVIAEELAEKAEKEGMEVKEFSEYSSLSRNMKKVKTWAAGDIEQRQSQCVSRRQENSCPCRGVTEL